ncbi:hypothetical protein DITRI_Ditri13aG0069800 [Diplodiscus trichospermus]
MKDEGIEIELVVTEKGLDMDIRTRLNEVKNFGNGFHVFTIDPGDFLLSDFAMFNHPPLLHIAYQVPDKSISKCSHFNVLRPAEDAKMFIVGAGTLVFELKENIELLGVLFPSQGKLRIIIVDVVEQSNLNEQFLSRDWNNGHAKLIVVASTRAPINSQLNIEGLLGKITTEVNAYLSNPAEYATSMTVADTQAKDNLERIFECFDNGKCELFQGYGTWTNPRFEDYLVNRVQQLIFISFWSAQGNSCTHFNLQL